MPAFRFANQLCTLSSTSLIYAPLLVPRHCTSTKSTYKVVHGTMVRVHEYCWVIPQLRIADLAQANSLGNIIRPVPPVWIRYCLHKVHTVKRDSSARFFGLDFFHGSTLYGPLDFETKRIFFSFSFSHSYSKILMNPRCRLLQGFKIRAVAYYAYSHYLL